MYVDTTDFAEFSKIRILSALARSWSTPVPGFNDINDLLKYSVDPLKSVSGLSLVLPFQVIPKLCCPTSLDNRACAMNL